MLARIVKRRKSLESPDELYSIEFRRADRAGPDLALSAYDVPQAALAQTHAEHGAGAGLDPPRRGCQVDLAGLRPQVVRVPGAGSFSLTRDAHREVRLASADDLRRLAEEVFAQVATRAGEVARGEILAHAAAQISAGDLEWLTFCRKSPKARAWGCPPAPSSGRD